jgi:hypothetical protein
MYLFPMIAFFVSSAMMVMAERAYFNGLVLDGSLPRSDVEAGEEIRRNPAGLPRIVATETRLRLRALLIRQRDPARERQRFATLILAGLTLACLVWTARWF